jgi:F-type H+-transporting ATPase subunit epsilon
VRLVITTPTAVVADLDEIAYVRAEDESGAFGILSRHADLLTALAPSVLTWRRRDGAEGYCAVRGGVLTVAGGTRVAVATREAVLGDDLVRLERDVVGAFRAAVEDERAARAHAARLHAAAIRRIIGYLRPRAGTLDPFGTGSRHEPEAS